MGVGLGVVVVGGGGGGVVVCYGGYNIAVVV